MPVVEVREESFFHSPCQGHAVQFFSSDLYYSRALAEFVKAGFVNGEGIILALTKPHWEMVINFLEKEISDLQEKIFSGQLLFVDAEKCLESIMVGDQPEKDAFIRLFEPVIVQQKAHYKRLRVYGELVDVLCRAGNYDAAVMLENFWSELLKCHPEVLLMCGYSEECFTSKEKRAYRNRLSKLHNIVMEDEYRIRSLNKEELVAKIAALSQRSLALEIEIKNRSKAAQVAVTVSSFQNVGPDIEKWAQLSSDIGQELNNPLTIVKLSAERAVELLDHQSITENERLDVIRQKLNMINTATGRISQAVKKIDSKLSLIMQDGPR